MECLEQRALLSNIEWVNRGNDGFEIFNNLLPITPGLSNAEVARNVVDAAIASWERVIVNFNQLREIGQPERNRIDLTLAVQGFGSSNTIVTTQILNDGILHPTAGTILIGRGTEVGIPDGVGDGGDWFLDPTPLDHSEFPLILNPFLGQASQGSPAMLKVDLYSAVLHGLTTIVGINSDSQKLQNPDAGDVTNTLIADDSNGGVGRYMVFDGPSVTHLMTSNSGGASSISTGAIAHSASAGGASQPINFNSAFRGNRQLVGVRDHINTSLERSARTLISEHIALILDDAYSYSIASREQFQNFHTLLNPSTGNLLVRGAGALISDDAFSLRREGTDLVVSVDIGDDPPGTGPNGDDSNVVWISRLPMNAVTSITIEGGHGDDRLTLDFTAGNVIPAGGISYAGNFPNIGFLDEIRAIANASFNLSRDALVVGGFGTITFPEFLSHAELIGGAAANTFTVDSSWLSSGRISGGGGTDTIVAGIAAGNFILSDTGLTRTDRGSFDLASVERATLTGGPDSTTFGVTSWSGIATLNGGAGTNQVNSANDANFSLSNTSLNRSTGGSFSLQSIQRVLLNGGSSANNFAVNGWTGDVELHGFDGGDTYQITLNGSGQGTYLVNDSGASGLDDLTINGTTGIDNLIVQSDRVLRGTQSVTYTAGVDQLRINTLAGADAITVQSAADPLTLNSGDQSDTVTLIYSRTLAIGSPPVFSIPLGVTVAGDTGTADILNVSFNYETDTDLTSTRLTGAALGASGLTYGTVERLNLSFGSLVDILDILSTDALVTTSINAGGGSDSLRLGGVTVNGIRGPVTIEGGANSTSGDRLTLQESEPAGVVNQGFLGTPASAGPGVGFLGGFGMGGPSNNVTFASIESVQIVTGASNDFVAFQFASPPQFAVSLNLDGGNDGIVFEGTEKSDRINLGWQVGPGGPEIIALINGQTIVAGYRGGDTIQVFAGDGNDHVSVDASVTTWRAELFGEGGNDHLVGGLRSDLLDGGDGNDRLEGAEGDDSLFGRMGRDYFDGGSGIDSIFASDADVDTILADIADLLASVDREDRIRRGPRLLESNCSCSKTVWD